MSTKREIKKKSILDFGQNYPPRPLRILPLEMDPWERVISHVSYGQMWMDCLIISDSLPPMLSKTWFRHVPGRSLKVFGFFKKLLKQQVLNAKDLPIPSLPQEVPSLSVWTAFPLFLYWYKALLSWLSST